MNQPFYWTKKWKIFHGKSFHIFVDKLATIIYRLSKFKVISAKNSLTC